MCILIPYSNCFSTKPHFLVHVCATRLYRDNDKKAEARTTVKNASHDEEPILTIQNGCNKTRVSFI